ncbi:MAG: 50S ribosomal protein L1 [Gammaproteobacteria bacterium]
MIMVTKKQKNILDSVDSMIHYSLTDAVKILQDHKSTKFDESLDVAIKLGVDGDKSDQNVRGAITLPNSLGKEVVVAVFADGDAAEDAKSAGADFIGMDDLSEKFTKNEITVDVVISTQAAMKVVGKLGQVLGPKGLMPNPKTGTVTDNVSEAIKNAKSGQVRFRTDKSGIIHGCIGKVSFDDGKVGKNLTALVEELKRLKPASAKGEYIKGISISSTMGPGLKLNISELA